MRPLRVLSAIVAVGCLVPTSPGSLGAQGERDADDRILAGRVVDASTGAPVHGAFVARSEEDWGVLTDPEGRFRLPEALPLERRRRITLTVEMLGYQTLERSIVVAPGQAPLTIRLSPRPILLEGLEVVVDRFEHRRRAVAMPVRVFDREELLRHNVGSILDLIRIRYGLYFRPCPDRPFEYCIRRRGRLIRPTIYIDEAPVFGGITVLDLYEFHDFYMVEVFGRGRQIRAYTTWFMEKAAGKRLSPVPIF